MTGTGPAATVKPRTSLPTLAVEDRPIESLIPYIRNARTHSPAQVSLIAGSIREFGFNNPILIDRNNGVIAGHGCLLAAQQLKLSSVPSIELSHLTDTQKRAYVLADNKLAERAGWDAELLALEAGSCPTLASTSKTSGSRASNSIS
ncbi:ParB/Srx family N-terminal domain-containing protein [Acuticoccus sp. MNP-M23]|uniref:ParB/Srx family N-terminal domain-containing protein n=1 Tax=Acuticoccus sp. MNP-M23 TaxID=3072793 RepID=UPI0028149A48|nr:ParB/Srx family N-terminal domain-containing protein [Acuticoccus sp. MNP-M23]WMS41840.1 ParB/Srx family N-terminal domain-containing protein [Acuticoccus sp. MNP-M23]